MYASMANGATVESRRAKACYNERYWLSSLVVWLVTRWESHYGRIVRPERRTKLWEGLQEDKPLYYKMRDDRSYRAMSIVRSKMWEYSGAEDEDDVMVFDQKVRLVSPFAMATEVLVSVLKALALRRASVLEELHSGPLLGSLSSGQSL